VPASFFVICHVRRKLACSCCETIVQAPVPSRPIARGIHLQTHLVHFSGVLQADAYARVIAFYVDGMIKEAACWAHARHNFYGLNSARPSAITTETLRRIAELYVIEAEIRGKAPDELQRVSTAAVASQIASADSSITARASVRPASWPAPRSASSTSSRARCAG